ncbi:MAG TPA: hypothetical protein PKD61_35930, partial [Polyangiaceae bacterium]|nr:hypothetical protein [Polyangiaceae bacterium]
GGCSATELQCAGACVDAATDANNCGACGSVCASGAVCVKGTCACPDTQTLCGGACADTNADASNCGDCGQTCLSGGLCLAGKCACPDAQMECGGACVDAERDVANCGSCGNACATNLTCIEGTCGPWAEQVALSETGDACARFKDDTVRCWKIGVAPTAPFSLPGVVQVEKGHDSSCALLSDGTVRCWGWNFYGQLGDGTNVDRLAPVAVKGLEGVQQISTGEYHSCARLSDGTIRCWGSNLSGEIGGGGGTWKMHATPVPVPGVSQVAAVAAGTRHTCVGLNDGGVRCWGTSYKGGLGVGPTDGIVVKPTTVPFLPGVIQVAAGLNSTCALLGTGSVKCWGQGYFGSLGNHSSPKSIVGLSNVAQIATSGAHHCALDKDGSLRCWGKNHGGQVGDGTTTERLAPTLVSAIAEVKQVALQP